MATTEHILDNDTTIAQSISWDVGGEALNVARPPDSPLPGLEQLPQPYILTKLITDTRILEYRRNK